MSETNLSVNTREEFNASVRVLYRDGAPSLLETKGSTARSLSYRYAGSGNPKHDRGHQKLCSNR